ncbi:hypothetical protein [Gordonia aurantiaca]|uniref:hypothetical protein n=1 Tax=Gordonia sp. B21 TaxID=3151852 RepID=UPI0032637814
MTSSRSSVQYSVGLPNSQGQLHQVALPGGEVPPISRDLDEVRSWAVRHAGNFREPLHIIYRIIGPWRDGPVPRATAEERLDDLVQVLTRAVERGESVDPVDVLRLIADPEEPIPRRRRQ